MSPGDDVVYLADPLLYGIGEILEVAADGRLLIRFDEDDRPALFNAHEVELLSRFQAAA